MGPLSQCTACQQHFYARESACPHCQAPAPASPVRRWADHARKSGILLFAALTTTACYGTPPYPGVMAPTSPGSNQPIRRIPTTLNTAMWYITPQSGSPSSYTIQLDHASLSGNHLELHGGTQSAPLDFTAQATASDAFTQKANIFDSVDVSALSSMTFDATVQAPAPGATAPKYTVHLPGDQDVQGTIQLSSVDEASVAGILRIQKGSTLFEVYFWAARKP